MTQSSSLIRSSYIESNESSEPTHATENGETGNKFGRGIEFREGAPIQLLKYTEDPEDGEYGKIVLNPEAIKILQLIREPLAIISVGKYSKYSILKILSREIHMI